MLASRLPCAASLFLVLATPLLVAQEPDPAKISASSLSDPDGVGLTFAWRFAPGDELGREAPDFNDSHWIPLRPGMASGELPSGGWPGVGWFRRHLIAAPAIQGRACGLRFAALGAADVYLDGTLVLSLGRGGAPPETSWKRNDARRIRLEGAHHVLAVRYVYPKSSAPGEKAIGFLLSLADPTLVHAAETEPPWMAGILGAIVALPLFLAFLHFTFFAFDRSSRWNLFYALMMSASALILLRQYQGILLQPTTEGGILDLIGRGMPVVATLFGLLTYYAVRKDLYPPTWRAFVLAGLVLLPLTYVSQAVVEYGWEVYFLAVTLEIVRLERSGRTPHVPTRRFYLVSMVIVVLLFLLQILVNGDVIPAVAGFRSYYVLGILALAVAVSLSLAHELGRSRLVKVENERKTAELAQARELQLSMLPPDLPVVSGLDVAAASHTATEVGGDYYDIRTGGGGSLLVAFGDATGHGLAAGIVVTAVKALFTSLPVNGALSELLAGCNDVLRGMRLPGLRMCLALARVSPRAAAVASAAMPPILIHRSASDAIEELGAGDLPLGGRIPIRYEERRTDLAPGDTLLFASDGFPELLDPAGREQGYAGAAQAFREAARGSSAREVVERLADAATAYRRTRPQDDDITFVVIRVA